MQGTTKPSGRVVAVSGGSAGIGRAIAEAVARTGASVAVGARGEARRRQTTGAIEAGGGRAVGLPLDVTESASIEAFFDGAEQALGPVTTVVSCAAHARPGRFWERSPEDICAEITAGLTGALLFARAGIARMIARRDLGDVVFISSTTAAVPWPYLATYAATKAGVEQGARTLALELEGSGIRVTVVRVGNTTGTDWASAWGEDDFALAGEWQRFGVIRHPALMQPADVAEAVVRVIDTPRGVHLDLVSVHPEAPPDGATSGRGADG